MLYSNVIFGFRGTIKIRNTIFNPGISLPNIELGPIDLYSTKRTAEVTYSDIQTTFAASPMQSGMNPISFLG